ncbi:chemotaxis protein CheD [Thermodesulfitimonas autotrophica]|uniref:Probable chemoreceptor glutamine deamidase CheD n=1 Tax=Thermodesulfitimonas autotrophica TaxID=1894989 RepID=A0A3N5ABG7_9THEO|nr:chemotaxis protein CheD [Thermodesulfitimonas autotrophica]RPF42939.1 chemotaxis protein CheD [Thermodesulfitimonas autotrophica]
MQEVAKAVIPSGTPEVQVGIADWKVGKEPVILITLGLGSCVGITLYDPVHKIGGLVHVMLPRMADFSKGSGKPAKFADTGIPLLLEEVLRLGANRRLLEAKMAGGAQMFTGADNKFRFDIGERNVEVAREVLRNLGIKVVAEDVGGNRGRTMVLDTATGRVMIKTLGSQIKEI